MTALYTILQNCKEFAEKPALHWLDAKNRLSKRYTYLEVEKRSQEMALGLQQLARDTRCKKTKEQRVVLCFLPELDFIVAFLACLRARLIPVPVIFPEENDLFSTKTLVAHVVRNSKAAFVLTNKEIIHDHSVHEIADLTTVPWYGEISTEPINAQDKEESTGEQVENNLSVDEQLLLCEESDDADPNNIAFLQYSSGCTGYPKGVKVTYANLLHNFKLMKEYCQTNNKTVEVSFIPHCNSIGLISSYLNILYCGGQGYYMSPKTFLNTPDAWIQAVLTYKATHIKAPNFALERLLLKCNNYCLNLESVESILICMESANINTIRSYELTRSKFKLGKNVIQFGYGLAEHVAFLSVSRIGDVPIINYDRVSCGEPFSGVDVKIVDPDTRSVVVEGDVGEIWVASDSKAVGFLDDDKTTREVFQAKLNSLPEKTYLRTGDLGVMMNGRLFVCEKMPDAILMKGKTIYPTDVERIVSSVIPALLPGKTLVFKTDAEEEGLTVVVELNLSRDHSQKLLELYSDDIALKIQTTFTASNVLVVFVRPHTLPFAASRRRQLCKELLETGKLPVIFKWPKAQNCTKRNSFLTPTKCVHKNTKVVQVDSRPSASRVTTESAQSSHAVTRTLSQFLTVPEIRTDTEVEQLRKSATTRNSEYSLKPNFKNYVRKSSMLNLSNSVGNFFGRTIEPDSNLWENGRTATQVRKLSDYLTHEFGFVVKPQDVCMTQTPKCIYRVFQSLLLDIRRTTCNDLSTDDAIAKPILENSGTLHSKTISNDKKVTAGSILSNVYASKCNIPLDETTHNNEEIAIVGMGGSFADCETVSSIWNLMAANQTAIVAHKSSTGNVHCGGFCVSSIGRLDHRWFGIMDDELPSVHPRHAMVLYTAWECLYSAGYAATVGSPTSAHWGVFVGTSASGCQEAQGSTAASFIARTFNLTGPALTIDTGTSSSLSALDVACLHLKSEKCNAAIVCGVHTLTEPSDFPDHHNTHSSNSFKVFDKDVTCNIPGEGSGAALLMTVGKARYYNRRILAVVKATAINNNGAESASISTPSMSMQVNVMSEALKKSKILPMDVSHVETDATGCKWKDKIELDAIQTVFASTKTRGLFGSPHFIYGPADVVLDTFGCTTSSDRKADIVLGCLKPNFGDMGSVAGIAGLIKTVAILEHSQAPGIPTLKHLDPEIARMKGLTFPTKLTNLPGNLLSAVVNSFGSTGTNVSAVLQQYSPLPSMAGVRCCLLLSTTGYTNLKHDMLSSFAKQFPIIQNAGDYFNQVVEKTCQELDIKPERLMSDPSIMTLRLYYAMTTQLYMLSADLSLVGGTDAIGEVLALVFSGAIDLASAIKILANLSKDSVLMVSPKILVYSSMEKKVLYPNCFSREMCSSYISALISRVHKKKYMLSVPVTNILQHLNTTFPDPSLCFTLKNYVLQFDTKNCIAVSVETMEHSKNYSQYIAACYIKLRSICDDLRAERDTNKPLRCRRNIMPDFYNRFPIRKTIEEMNDRGTSQRIKY